MIGDKVPNRCWIVHLLYLERAAERADSSFVMAILKKKSRFVFVVYLPQILNNIVSTDFHAE